jgi:hypothetical protein
MKTKIWNLRFRIAWAILPGIHKHVSVSETHDECGRSECR